MKAELHKHDSHVTIEVHGINSSIEDLVEMVYYGMIAMSYAPQTVASALYEFGNEKVDFFYPDKD